ncbi:MFS transporter [Ruminococcaceae bacterium OttesenSCG-928-O06]|nr:MFS transporter [Ruminococcaceae bacterium OttesenSCG-928-O06]
MKTGKLKRWPYLLLGMLLFIFAGVVYAWSLFAEPLEAAHGWTRAETSMVFTICMVMFNIANVVGGFLVNKTSIRVNMIITTVCLLAGFISSAYVSSVWQLYLTYGVLIGFGIGLSYSPTISVIVSWFPDKPGMASGMLLLAFGMSTLVVGTQVARLFGIIGIERTFITIGIVAAAVVLFVSFFMKTPPKDAVFPKPAERKSNPDVQGEDMPSSQVIRRPSFWLFMLWQTGIVTAGMAVVGQAATAATSIGATVALATVATSGLSVANGVSRFFWGTLCDILGITKIRMLLSITALVGFGISIAGLATSNVVLLIVSFIIIGMAYGGSVGHPASFVRTMYGSKYYASNFSLVFMPGFITAFIGPTIMAAVYSSSGYLPAFCAMGALALVGGVAGLFIKKP